MAGERGANDLFEYIRQFILSPGMGYGYVFTNAMLIMAAVMLLRDFPKNKKGIAQFFIEYLVCCASYILLDSLLFWLTSGWQMDRIALSQRDGDAAHFRTAGRIIRVPERIVFCLGAVSDAAGGDGHDFYGNLVPAAFFF